MKADQDTREMIVAGLMAVVLITLACLFSGCGWWKGIDVKIRPGGHPDTTPKVEPAPAPQPPPDDWAPPWFHRPKPAPQPSGDR